MSYPYSLEPEVARGHRGGCSDGPASGMSSRTITVSAASRLGSNRSSSTVISEARRKAARRILTGGGNWT